MGRRDALIVAFGAVAAFASPYVVPRDEWPAAERALMGVGLFGIAAVAAIGVDWAIAQLIRRLRRRPVQEEVQ